MKLTIESTEYIAHFSHNRQFRRHLIAQRPHNRDGVYDATVCRIHTGACLSRDGRCITPVLVVAGATLTPVSLRRTPHFSRRTGVPVVSVRKVRNNFDASVGRKLAFQRALLKLCPRIDVDEMIACDDDAGDVHVALTENRHSRARRTLFWSAYFEAIRPRDRCELCAGKRGGQRGNENLIVVEGEIVIACNKCASDREPNFSSARKLSAPTKKFL